MQSCPVHGTKVSGQDLALESFNSREDCTIIFDTLHLKVNAASGTGMSVPTNGCTGSYDGIVPHVGDLLLLRAWTSQLCQS